MGRAAQRAAAGASNVPPAVRRKLRREQGIFWAALTAAVLASGNLWRGVEVMARGTVSSLAWVRIAALTLVLVVCLAICGRILARQSALRTVARADGGQAAGTLGKG